MLYFIYPQARESLLRLQRRTLRDRSETSRAADKPLSNRSEPTNTILSLWPAGAAETGRRRGSGCEQQVAARPHPVRTASEPVDFVAGQQLEPLIAIEARISVQEISVAQSPAASSWDVQIAGSGCGIGRV